MTRAARDRILKDMNGNISDHLHKHIHLTNCIHLKNHMHKHSPILTDRALMKDLVVLQRSRSLRDPSASPPSWHSSSAVDVLVKRGEREALLSGRRSLGIERHDGPATAMINHSGKDGISECRRVKREESSGRFQGNNDMCCNGDHSQDGNDLAHQVVSRPSESRHKNVKKKGVCRQDSSLKILSDQLKNVPVESDDAALSCNHDRMRSQVTKNAEEAGANIHSHGNNMNRPKRRKFRGARRNRPSVSSRSAEAQNKMSVASNSFAQGRNPRKYQLEEGVEEYDDQNDSGVPGNRCGIPWNWSRIHHRGKSFLDIAGQSLSCGLSESRLKKEGLFARGRGIHVMSEQSSSSTKSDGQALPLLLDASSSQGSINHAAWLHDYSGELGIYAKNLLKQELDSDLASEGRSREQHTWRRHPTDRHQNLTQKYMPRTFRDLVGQNLVVQALSNAILKRKVGLLYVFYGPHGTGKTTCARIFARALNCQSLESPKPCGYCDSCIAHDVGKGGNVREIGPVSNIDFEGIIELFNNMITSRHQSQYRVLIFDECDTLSSDCWSAILKVIDLAPRRVVFILVCSTLDVLPHVIISRCQKFFFPKLKDADITFALQWIATKEDLEIDKDALKLIASRSDGSLRDAEMTLEQLSLLGQRISLCLVQELVGLISDEKLVDLLDLALSADTVNTVKNLRDIMESGIEPLALMSQLATVITDILAGSYDVMKVGPRRKFFRRQALSKEDMEKLRQALKTLSEAEKQLRVSSDRMTWLTAALLQLAPDRHYMPTDSSADVNSNHSPLIMNNSVYLNAKSKGISMEGKERVGREVDRAANDKIPMTNVQLLGKLRQGIEEIWLEVLEKIPVHTIKEFMHQEGKLISVSYGAAPTAQLLLTSQQAKSKAEKFKPYILQAFESVLGSPVTIKIRCESRNDIGPGPILLPPSHGVGSSQSNAEPIFRTDNGLPTTNHIDIRKLQIRDNSFGGVNMSEIVEVDASSREFKCFKCKDNKPDTNKRNIESALVGVTTNTMPFPDQRKLVDRNQNLSLVKGKVSLAHVIQHAEGYAQHSGWSTRKAISIAEKLEQENLRLEPTSRGLLCWNSRRLTRRKFPRLKIRTRKAQTLLKLVPCGRCLSSRSPR
ncbi:Replication factor C, subunit RFC4 [Handroanthus impetiginosus]|uniref:Replication factor C, subunit RFC4 n=1 Tax=Handroanthus impetiginosus TaxID=429701 RepID=A0A2G9HV95_9LAMI|nr:Replication factor C, subunit RFC4 [Handroanthus impetiginosus]